MKEPEPIRLQLHACASPAREIQTQDVGQRDQGNGGVEQQGIRPGS